MNPGWPSGVQINSNFPGNLDDFSQNGSPATIPKRSYEVWLAREL